MPVTEEIQRKVLAEATSATPNYDIDYSDQRFTDVNDAKADALTDLEQTYGGMIGKASGFYQDQIDAVKGWGDQQTALQDQQTDFAIEKIEQQREQAQKDYLKEQSGAYVDWQKQSNKYGTAAEQMASAGLTGTGFAETSQVGMYNTYQLRVASARESFERAKLNFDNLITEARLENNAAKAEIAIQTLQKSLELALEGFQYENQLLLDKANKKIELDNMYYNRYQDVLSQINHENAVKEDIRQYTESMAWQTEQAELDRTFKAQEAELDRKHSAAQAEIQRKFQEAQAELDRKHDLALVAANTEAAKKKADHEHKLALEKLQKQQEYELAQLSQQLANEKALLDYKNSLSYGSVGGGSGSSKGSTTAQRSAAKQNSRSSNPRVQQYGAANSGKFTGSTYDQAVSFLKSKGISGAGVLTASEWSRRKSSYSMTGIGNAAVKNYSSYAEYLRDYVNYQVSNK